MPRRTAIGLLPAAMLRVPSLKIARANTVAVVVPSPAMSDVLDATSLTSLAPMFSKRSSNSTSLLTVTPSLVTVGPPNDLSMITLRPVGPIVTATASASFSTPRSIFARAVIFEKQLLCHDGGSLLSGVIREWLDEIARPTHGRRRHHCASSAVGFGRRR